MEGILDPEEARSRKFELVRRGYDRREVDRFRDEAAVSIAALRTELADLRSRMGQAGMEDVQDLKSELEAVSTQVAEILESARSAAEGMRSRASEDASRWRADADKEARAARASSAKDAEEARRSAWEEGTELLRQADAERKRLLEEAAQEALFIRAEAEREALRLTGDARRDKEEALRRARTESERLLNEARAESDRILHKARQSAEAAQQRAQALEQRRTELMKELEAARTSIGQLEQEIDTRREALQAAAESPDSGVRVIKSGVEGAAAWLDDDASVRIVPASRVAVDEPVDPDEFVAEVAQLQSEIASAAARGSDDTDDVSADADEGEPDAVAETTGESEAPVESPAETVETGDAEPQEDDEEDPGDEGAGAVVAAAEPVPEPAPAPVPPAPDGIDDLFARLRTEGATAPAQTEPPPPPEAGAAADQASVAVIEEAQVAEVVPIAKAREVATDPFELRERILLPIENRTLRSVKRRIVDLQNRVLEELRVGDDQWQPERSMFAAAVSEDIALLNQESFVAGYAAAADLVGAPATPPPDRAAGQETSGEFVDSFQTAVTEALSRARGSGGGSRQVSAAVGRVFRAWRTDEAERRLRHAAYLAYNQGLIGAYPSLGVESVVAVAPGAPCGACPAGTEASWEPGRPLPPGTAFPPARAECRATILPAG